MNRHKKDLENKKNGNLKRDALTGKLVNGDDVVTVKNALEYVKTLGYTVIPNSYVTTIKIFTGFLVILGAALLK